MEGGGGEEKFNREVINNRVCHNVCASARARVCVWGVDMPG